MPTPPVTAIELIKENIRPNRFDLGNLLRKFIEDKDYPPPVVMELSHTRFFGILIEKLLLRLDRLVQNVPIDTYGALIDKIKPAKLPNYLGLPHQNSNIDRALSVGNQTFGQGANTDFSISNLKVGTNLSRVPIAIVGYGAGGILVAFALRQIGFRNITVFEEAEPLGIWSRKNVYLLSRNNPRRINFFGHSLEKAPGDGLEVKLFLDQLSGEVTIRNTGVKRIVPRVLDHRLICKDGSEHVFPIVINAIGLGRPISLSDPRRMVTHTKNTYCGPRWQQKLKLANITGKRIVLIGLGNSTAEMLRQINSFRDQGYPVDYRILTHYPKDSVHNPNAYVNILGRNFRVFRDLGLPNLVDFQGDLPESRLDYFRALRLGKIIPGVKRWEVKNGTIRIYDKNKKLIQAIDHHLLYTLTGYKHTADDFEAMGISFDSEYECARYDYDGEFIRPLFGGKKVYRLKGYFGFGSILDAPHNPNAIVIPGMIFRLGDLLFGIIMRAMEFSQKDQNNY